MSTTCHQNRPERAVARAPAMLLIALLIVLPTVGSEPDAGRAQAAAPLIQLEPVVSDLSSPTFLTSARDGSDRLFIVEQDGVIKVLGRGARTPTVFLDIRTQVLTGGQQGLVGLAFHPQYASNGRFFIDYTRLADGATVIAEYRASAGDADVADPTERPLLTIPEPLPNLAGGTLAFGLDGFLYIGAGNAGVSNDPTNSAQDLTRLLGKILRIDVDHPSGGLPYSSPAGNPFFGMAPARDEIFAYGLRNPWRISFDRLTGDLLTADVGNHTREEVDLITQGGNYGWHVREGTVCTSNDPDLCNTPGFIEPLVDYPHTGARCAVIGGHVYRGTRGSLPAGSYVFGDFCSGEIFLLVGSVMRVLLETPLVIASFGEDEAGEIYVVDWLGTLYRITAPGAWTVVDYFPNPDMSALGYALRARDGSVETRYDLYNWSFTTSTGIFYQSVDEPQTGTLCSVGRPDGVHANYGRAGAGYDWYAVDAHGHHYLGWMFFHKAGGGNGRGECDFDIGVVSDPLDTVAYPRVVNDAALPPPHDFSIRAQRTSYYADGSLHNVGAVTETAYRLEVLQPGGPGTLLGLKISGGAGSNWYVIDWLSGPTECQSAPCWPRHLTGGGADQRGIWRFEEGNGVDAPFIEDRTWCPAGGGACD